MGCAILCLTMLASHLGAQSPTAAVMLTFEQTVLAPSEVCNGSIAVSGGDVLGLRGVLLDQDDRIEGAGWTVRAPGTQDDPGGRAVVRIVKRPKAIIASLDAPAGADVTVESSLGSDSVALSALPTTLFDGKLSLRLVPAAEVLTTTDTEDDYPSIATTPNGDLWVAWQAYDNTDDVVMVRRKTSDGWLAAEEITPRGDFHRPRIAAVGDGMWVVWAENLSGNWELIARRWEGEWSAPIRLTDHPLNDTQQNLATDARGRLWVVWQQDAGESHDIRAARITDAGLKGIVDVTRSPENDWEPTIVAAPGGGVQVAFDSYINGSYDIRTCRITGGKVTQWKAVATTAAYEAHASIAFDGDGRLWVAWDNGGEEWGRHKVLHRERALELACLDGDQLVQPAAMPRATIPEELSGHRELPHLVADGDGAMWLVFRHLVNVRRWAVKRAEWQGQSRGIWTQWAMRYEGASWSEPVLLPGSGGRNDMRVATCLGSGGELVAAWAGDERNIIRAEVPGNNNVCVAAIGGGEGRREASTGWQPVVQEAESGDGGTARDAGGSGGSMVRGPTDAGKNARATVGGYELLYGDTHRHTDMSRCGMNSDGSIQDTYRYAIDVAELDFLGISDHDQDILKHRYDRDERPLQNFMWWRSEKLVDAFNAGTRFIALYGFEHGGGYAGRGGHQNIMYTERGNPCIEVDAPKDVWAELEGRNAVMIPHQLADGTSATDWDRYDTRWEPVAEMFQARGAYEYPGCPRMAKVEREGSYLWDALVKGLKIGVIASSDHGLTHGAYAGVYATERSREAILEAMRARRTFGATAMIAMDFRLGEALMGEEVEIEGNPTFSVGVTGTDAIRRIDIISDGKFVYTRTREPGAAADEFEVMLDMAPGQSSYYYLRCIQADNEMAWSSPIWVTRRGA